MIDMTLLFVYNAKSNFMNKSLDYAHKLFSPQTYTCNLCNLTHSSFGERSEWKDFRLLFNNEFQFYYADKFEREFNLFEEYPVIYIKDDDKLRVLLSANEIRKFNDLKELINNLENQLISK